MFRIIIFLIINFCKCTNFIYTEISNIDVAYYIDLEFESKMKSKCLPLVMNLGFSYINGQISYSKNIESMGQTYINYINQPQLKANIFKDKIFFKNTNLSLNSFQYLYLDQHRSDGAISLAYTFMDQKFDIIHQMYNDKLINKKNFAFYIDSLFRGKLFFGGIPPNLTKIYKYSQSCQVRGGNFWGCDLYAVKYGNKIYNNIHLSFFQSDFNGILVPFDFFEQYFKEVIEGYILNRTCTIREIGKKVEYECNCQELDYFPSISFQFYNFEITFTRNDLFLNYTRVCFFSIKNNYNSINNWEFGLPAFKKYIVQFDYGENWIRFYSEDPSFGNKRYMHNYFGIIKILCIILIIISSALSIIVLIINYSKHF